SARGARRNRTAPSRRPRRLADCRSPVSLQALAGAQFRGNNQPREGVLAALSLLALALALWLTAPSTPVHADSSPAGRPLHVVCVSSWSPPRGKHRIKPRRCTLHVRGAFPIAGYNTQIFTKLRWKRWGPRKAKAKGKLLVSTVGPVKAKLE